MDNFHKLEGWAQWHLCKVICITVHTTDKVNSLSVNAVLIL